MNTQKPEPSGIADEEKMWAMFAHLSPLVGLGPLGPLIIWLVKKDQSPFVDDQGKEALNFNLSVLIASLVLAVTCIGPLIIAIWAMVLCIIAGVEASKGVAYRYPYSIRLIR